MPVCEPLSPKVLFHGAARAVELVAVAEVINGGIVESDAAVDAFGIGDEAVAVVGVGVVVVLVYCGLEGLHED